MLLAAFASQLPFTELLNRLSGGAVTQLLGALGIHPHDPAHPIPNFVAMQILLVLSLTGLFLIVRSRLSVEQPGFVQHIAESIHEFVEGYAHQLIGHGAARFVPFLTSILLFILGANLMGVIPTLESPTANPSVPLGCAITTFITYHWHGIRAQGLHYIQQFIGPTDSDISLVIRIPLGLLILPIELVSHSARLLSLTVRLWANIFAGDMVTLAFFSLIPIGLPVMFTGLHIGVSLVQAFIFMLLTTVYISSAVAAEH
ncbi:MAG: F0F1 ATP synthase subunit A [Terriglobales bacterium]